MFWRQLLKINLHSRTINTINYNDCFFGGGEGPLPFCWDRIILSSKMRLDQFIYGRKRCMFPSNHQQCSATIPEAVMQTCFMQVLEV